MAKEKKTCKKCGEEKKDCTCPEKRKKGWYGLDIRHGDDDDMDGGEPMGAEDGGGLGEAIKMPKAPSDADRSMKGISSEKKKKKLEAFKAHADEAKKRQRDEDRKGELAKERRTKGIRFYDAKGSGYIRSGKKEYD